MVLAFRPANVEVESATPFPSATFWHGPLPPPSKPVRKRVHAAALLADDDLSLSQSGDDEPGNGFVADEPAHDGVLVDNPFAVEEEDEEEDDPLSEMLAGLMEADELGILNAEAPEASGQSETSCDSDDDNSDRHEDELPAHIFGRQEVPEADLPAEPCGTLPAAPLPQVGQAAGSSGDAPRAPTPVQPAEARATGLAPTEAAGNVGAGPRGRNLIRCAAGSGFILKNETGESLDAHCELCGLKVNRKFTGRADARGGRALAQGRPMGLLLAVLAGPCPGDPSAHRGAMTCISFDDRLRARQNAVSDGGMHDLFSCERPARPDEVGGEPAMAP